MPTVFIAGANRGIGLEFAKEYHAAGWKVIASVRSVDKAAPLKALGAGVQVEILDLADHAAIDGLGKKLSGTPIDVLIASAGVSGTDAWNEKGPQAFGHLDYQNIREVLEVNALAPLKLLEVLCPNLAKSSQKKAILLTSRMGSIAETSEGAVAYRMSKAALNMGIAASRLSLKRQGITAIVMHPGWVRTDMGGSDAPVTVQDSVSGMRRVIEQLLPERNGKFLNYRGEEQPW